MRNDTEIVTLAAEQHGTVASWQLAAIGLDREQTQALRQSTGWTALSTRVLTRTGSPPTKQRDLMAAVLDASPGAAVSGTSAAAMWGVPGFRVHPIQVVRHKGISRRPSALAVVHEVVDLCPSHVKVLGGIPVISPARLVCELTATHPHRAGAVLDRLWTEGLVDGRTFHRTVLELAGRGRTGSPLMRELDDARGNAYVPPASGLERRFIEINDEPMDRQVDCGGDEEWSGRVDFRHNQLPVVVEVQSEKYHTSLTDRAADTARRSRLETAGYLVVEVWDTEVWHEPAVVRERVRQAVWRARVRAA